MRTHGRNIRLRTGLRFAVLALGALICVSADAQDEATRPAVIHAIEDAFKTANPDVKRRIISTLREIGAPAVPLLMDALGDDSDRIRSDAADALGDIGKPARPAIPYLLAALEDGSRRVRQNAINAIGRIGDGTDAAQRLVPFTSDSSDAVRKQAIRALGRLRVFTPEIGSALLGTLKDDKRDIRRESERALPRLGPAAIPLLKDALASASQDDAPTLLRIIGDTGSEAVPHLIEALSHPVADVRREAADGLGDLRADSPEVVTALVGALKDPSDRVRIEAVDALGDSKVASPLLPDALETTLRDGSSSLRQRSVEALGQIQVPPQTVVRYLIEALADPDEGVREAATEVLKSLGGKE